MSSPTQRTLALLRKEGYLPAIVEKTIPRINTRLDLWNAWDVLAINPQGCVVAVQTTSASNVHARLVKLATLDVVQWCDAAGWILEVHGWSKRGPRGKRKTWQCTRLRYQTTLTLPITRSWQKVTDDGLVELAPAPASAARPREVCSLSTAGAGRPQTE